MAKLTIKQQALVDALEATTKGSRGLVVAFGDILSDYTVSFNADELNFILSVFAKKPRLLVKAKAIITKLLPVTLKKGSYKNIDNLKSLKEIKVECRIAVKKFNSSELKSLLDFEKTKKESADFDKVKASNNFGKSVSKLLENGMTKDELIRLINLMK